MHRGLSPGTMRGTQIFVGQAAGRWSLNPPAHHIVVTDLSRHPFRVCCCARHHPLTRTRHSNCLAGVTPCLRLESRRRLGPGPAWSYLGHSHQSAAIEAPADAPAPDTTPAATLLARLFLSFTTAVTLAGRASVHAHQACPRLPPRHGFQSHCGTDFRG